MKRKPKPGAEKKLRWIRRLAAVMQAVAVVIFFLLALHPEPSLGRFIKAAIAVGGLCFWIKVYEAANELLTGYIYD